MDPGAGAARLSRIELARTAGVDEAFVERLVRAGILRPSEDGHLHSDVHRVRYAALAAGSGIEIEDLAASLAGGVARYGDVDLLFPQRLEAPRMTHAELSADIDVPVELVARIRLAAGLPSRDPDDPVPNDEERILRLIVRLSRGFGDVETSIRIARNYGERIQRIVVSGVGAYEELVYEHLLRSQPTFDVETSRRTSEAGRQLIDAAEELLVAAHRRHMEAALLAMWVRGTETRMALNGIVDETTDRLPAIAFVDLSGFTRLTEEEGDALGLWLEERLVSEAELAAAAHGARIVKRLGDGVMLHGTEPARLVQTAVQLVDTLPRAGLPSAHAGIHAGPLIERDGDYFGRTVNLAARIAGQASAGEVLLSPTAAARAPAGLRLTELPPVQLRGISEPTILFRVERT